MEIEYRVLPITRWIVTRYENDGEKASVCEIGSYSSENDAREVAGALRFMRTAIEQQTGKHPAGAAQADPNKLRSN